MRRFFVLYTAVLLSLTPFGAIAQQVEATNDQPPMCFLLLSGEFDGSGKLNLDRLLTSYRQKGCEEIVAFLDSPGGDVAVAMEVGRMLRRARAWTDMRNGGSCASACVLTFLGGVNRRPHGKIGLHRAYAASPSDSAKDAQTKRDEIDRLITEMGTLTDRKAEIEEMKIPLRSDECPDCGCKVGCHNSVLVPAGKKNANLDLPVAHCGACGTCWKSKGTPFVELVRTFLDAPQVPALEHPPLRSLTEVEREG